MMIISLVIRKLHSDTNFFDFTKNNEIRTSKSFFTSYGIQLISYSVLGLTHYIDISLEIESKLLRLFTIHDHKLNY